MVRVFILPPSMVELRARLERRATDSMEVIDARMDRAANEVSHWDGYDYVLVNDDVEQCFQCVKTILAAERLKRSKPARELCGAPCVEHYAATRDWEDRESRKAITEWELARYFEII